MLEIKNMKEDEKLIDEIIKDTMKSNIDMPEIDASDADIMKLELMICKTRTLKKIISAFMRQALRKAISLKNKALKKQQAQIKLFGATKVEIEELKKLIKAYQRTHETENRLLCETVQKRDELKHQLQEKDKEIEIWKGKHDYMVSEFKRVVGKAHKQKDDIFKEIEEMLDKLHRPTVNPNMIMQNNIITSLKEKIIEHLKHRKD